MSHKIAEAMVAIGAVGFRPHDPIKFKSGILSPVYCDNRQFPFWPEQWGKVIKGFAALAQSLEFDVIGGIEARRRRHGC